MKYMLLLLVVIAAATACPAQRIRNLAQKDGVSLRGIYVTADGCLWVSGTRGTVGRRTGVAMEWQSVTGFENRDFRDIHAFDSLTAIAMAVDNPGLIIRTTDGGKNWTTVFEKSGPGMFLDDLVFEGANGYCIGDPVDGYAYLLQTQNSGETWQEVAREKLPAFVSGEAFFAASGTNSLIAKNKLLWVTGGIKSNLYA